MKTPSRFIVKEVDSDLLFYDSAGDSVHILNQTARTVYELLRKGRTEEEIIDTLKKTSGVREDDTVEKDVRNCIAALVQKGLLAES
ncbi:MAG: PqqD family protein [Deltaproteobacteria bacterium]|jgi:hypothetical protein|nr:PqqD family protein [Syntrophaceae bacterium]